MSGQEPPDRAVSFEHFVAARSGQLLRTAYLLTGDHQLAEDLLQTALTKAWFVWARIDRSPEPYVRKILLNQYVSGWRRRCIGEVPTELLPEDGTDVVAYPDARQDLRSALARLPKRQRAVVVLRYFEDLSEADTARALGCSVGTVKSQAAKALAKLRVDDSLVDSRVSNSSPSVGTERKWAR